MRPCHQNEVWLWDVSKALGTPRVIGGWTLVTFVGSAFPTVSSASLVQSSTFYYLVAGTDNNGNGIPFGQSLSTASHLVCSHSLRVSQARLPSFLCSRCAVYQSAKSTNLSTWTVTQVALPPVTLASVAQTANVGAGVSGAAVIIGGQINSTSTDSEAVFASTISFSN